MNSAAGILVCILLVAGSPSAQTIIMGSLRTSTGTWHKIYMDDGLIPVETERGVVMVQGVYRSMHDGSPGYITIRKQEWGAMVRLLAHEMCHAEQSDTHRPFDEKECNLRG